MKVIQVIQTNPFSKLLNTPESMSADKAKKFARLMKVSEAEVIWEDVCIPLSEADPLADILKLDLSNVFRIYVICSEEARISFVRQITDRDFRSLLPSPVKSFAIKKDGKWGGWGV